MDNVLEPSREAPSPGGPAAGAVRVQHFRQILILFAVVTVPTTVLLFYTVRKSRRLSEFLDAVSEDEWKLLARLRKFSREKK